MSGNIPLGGQCDIHSSFNERFQELLELMAKMKSSVEGTLTFRKKAAINNALIELAQDFIYSAETYGRLIISECALEDKDRIIKCANMGGQLGGEFVFLFFLNLTTL